jgi:hypothetical protein
MTKHPYTKPNRLAHVLALIQVLAFRPTRASERGWSDPEGIGGYLLRREDGLSLLKNTLKFSEYRKRKTIHYRWLLATFNPAMPLENGNHCHKNSRPFSSRQRSNCTTDK